MKFMLRVEHNEEQDETQLNFQFIVNESEMMSVSKDLMRYVTGNRGDPTHAKKILEKLLHRAEMKKFWDKGF